jgi:RimJ/RimL family protein N-acetyltransferase
MQNGILKCIPKTGLKIWTQQQPVLFNQIIDLIDDYRNGNTSSNLYKKSGFNYSDYYSENEFNNYNHYFLLDNNKLMGLTRIELTQKNTAYLSSFIINPEYRGGYGKVFLNLVCSDLIKKNIDKIELKVHEDNFIAQNCYLKSGFKIDSKLNKRYIMNKII